MSPKGRNGFFKLKFKQMKIKFNHDSESTMKALGSDTTVDELADKLASISVKFLKGDKHRVSELSEMVTNTLTDEEILYVCTQRMYGTINQTMFEIALGGEMPNDNSLLN
jgi:hypothetical protein